MIALIRECSFDAQEAINAVRYKFSNQETFSREKFLSNIHDADRR